MSGSCATCCCSNCASRSVVRAQPLFRRDPVGVGLIGFGHAQLPLHLELLELGHERPRFARKASGFLLQRADAIVDAPGLRRSVRRLRRRQCDRHNEEREGQPSLTRADHEA
jgi:hypothetical protein